MKYAVRNFGYMSVRNVGILHIVISQKTKFVDSLLSFVLISEANNHSQSMNEKESKHKIKIL